jgi:hypothetical protein
MALLKKTVKVEKRVFSKTEAQRKAEAPVVVDLSEGSEHANLTLKEMQALK